MGPRYGGRWGGMGSWHQPTNQTDQQSAWVFFFFVFSVSSMGSPSFFLFPLTKGKENNISQHFTLEGIVQSTHWKMRLFVCLCLELESDATIHPLFFHLLLSHITQHKEGREKEEKKKLRTSDIAFLLFYKTCVFFPQLPIKKNQQKQTHPKCREKKRGGGRGDNQKKIDGQTQLFGHVSKAGQCHLSFFHTPPNCPMPSILNFAHMIIRKHSFVKSGAKQERD